MANNTTLPNSNSFTPEQLITAVAESNDRSQLIEKHLNLTESARICLVARHSAIESKLVNLPTSGPPASGLPQVKDHLQANGQQIQNHSSLALSAFGMTYRATGQL